MSSGKSVEVGLVGREGFIGLPATAGFATSPTRVVMQVEGNAFRISAADLKECLHKSAALELALTRFSQTLTLQATQIAACNRVHEVDQRLARWLLMSLDRLGGNSVPLTQDSLASMLGTRRASVTVAAGILQRAGLITYRRGDVVSTIVKVWKERRANATKPSNARMQSGTAKRKRCSNVISRARFHRLRLNQFLPCPDPLPYSIFQKTRIGTAPYSVNGIVARHLASTLNRMASVRRGPAASFGLQPT